MTRLQFERTTRRISQTQLALVTQIPQQTLSAIERGIRPTPDQLDALSRALDVAPELLLHDVTMAEAQCR